MTSDRSTLSHRGAPGELPPARPEVTAPAGRRLPSAPRERKPALAALALLLIVGGGLASALLVIRSGHRVSAIEITQEVGAGQKIPIGSMQEVQIASDTGLQYVSWNQRDQVTQTYAKDTIPPGTLLTSAMATQGSDVTSGKVVIGLSLKVGQIPSSGLRQGDHVAAYTVSGSASGANSGITPGTVLTSDAVVTDVRAPSQSGGTDTWGVSIAVDPGEAPQLTNAASNGSVAIVLLPAGSAVPNGGQTGQPPAGTQPTRSKAPGTAHASNAIPSQGNS